MSRIYRSAGNVAVVAYTDGAPIRAIVWVTQQNGERVEATVQVRDLEDLQYCVARVLAELAA